MPINPKYLTPHQAVMKAELGDSTFRQLWEASAAQREVVKTIMGERLRRKMSQEELAKRAGMKQPNIARIESGSRGVSIETLAKIAHAFGTKLDIQFKTL